MSEKKPARKVTPPNRLRQKIGHAANVRDLLKEEVIAEGQKLIDEKQEDFLKWAQEDVDRLSETLAKIQRDPMTVQDLETIVKCAEHLRDRGGTFGYDLISEMAKSLVNYCGIITSPSDNHAIVVSKHIESLTIVIMKRIKADGGQIGAELMKSLTELTKKYAP
jgi:chemotaxis protein histidine kinase CheA